MMTMLAVIFSRFLSIYGKPRSVLGIRDDDDCCVVRMMIHGGGWTTVGVVILVVWSQLAQSLLFMNPRNRLAPKPRHANINDMEYLSIAPFDTINGDIHLPGSKSLSNRVLLLSALCEGSTTIKNLSDCIDTQYMLSALRDLEVDCSTSDSNDFVVINGRGVNGLSRFQNNSEKKHLFLGNAGTAMRSLVAVLSAAQGNFVVNGTERMRERPIKDLVDALRQLNVEITCSATGCPPVEIAAKGLHGGIAQVSGKISSQFLSALLIAAPLSSHPVTLMVKDALVSAPYVHMTIALMKKFGVSVDITYDQKELPKFVVAPATYQSPGQINVEGDASSASYFLAGAAICPNGGRVTVHGCGRSSVQGDIRFADILRKMGASVQYTENSMTVWRERPEVPLQGVDEDCGDIPDAALTIAIVGVFAHGKTTIRNVYNWRVKESERMVAIVTELRKLGVVVEEGEDYLVVHGLGGQLHQLKKDVEIHTYDDHRMAMCFALIAFGGVAVKIQNPRCAVKTYPDYFSDLFALTKSIKTKKQPNCLT